MIIIEDLKSITLDEVKRIVDHKESFARIKTTDVDFVGLKKLLLAGLGSLNEIWFEKVLPYAADIVIENAIKDVLANESLHLPELVKDKVEISKYLREQGQLRKPLWVYSRLLNGIFHAYPLEDTISITELGLGWDARKQEAEPDLCKNIIKAIFQDGEPVVLSVDLFNASAVGEYQALWRSILERASANESQEIIIREMELGRFLYGVQGDEESFETLLFMLLEEAGLLEGAEFVDEEQADGIVERVFRIGANAHEVGHTQLFFQGFAVGSEIKAPFSRQYEREMKGTFRGDQDELANYTGVRAFWMKRPGKYDLGDINFDLTSSKYDDEHMFRQKRYDLLGAGGFGEVYSDTTTGHALKMFTSPEMWIADDLAVNELVICSQLNVMKSECIPAYYGLRTVKNDMTVVLEMELALCDLSDFCEFPEHNKFFGGIPASGDRRKTHWKIFRQMFVALAFLQSENVQVIHNDIKPSNFLVYIDGNGDFRVKLHDFGLSVPVLTRSLTHVNVEHIQHEQELYTDGYKAPEVTLHISDSSTAMLIASKAPSRCLYAADTWAAAMTMLEIWHRNSHISIDRRFDVGGAGLFGGFSLDDTSIRHSIYFLGAMSPQMKKTRYESRLPKASKDAIVGEKEAMKTLSSIQMETTAPVEGVIHKYVDMFKPNLLHMMLGYDWTMRPLANEILGVIGLPDHPIEANIDLRSIELSPALLRLYTDKEKERDKLYDEISVKELEALTTEYFKAKDEALARKRKTEFNETYRDMARQELEKNKAIVQELEEELERSTVKKTKQSPATFRKSSTKTK